METASNLQTTVTSYKTIRMTTLESSSAVYDRFGPLTWWKCLSLRPPQRHKREDLNTVAVTEHHLNGPACVQCSWMPPFLITASLPLGCSAIFVHSQSHCWKSGRVFLNANGMLFLSL
ncbi:hypothetical protein AAFF_G00112680 [Aldrovandia affinis]|uniref:Uncharacterized protein n=1 Tax=Aldrovandia affinis TaxID=143900 RepID=A0AAD7WAX4_9TELE|nr:hypothetical protein AAFF_G00112680 [Aldrovandia affinis]